MSDIMIEESVAFPWTCSTKRGCHAWQRGPPSQQLLAKIDHKVEKMNKSCHSFLDDTALHKYFQMFFK